MNKKAVSFVVVAIAIALIAYVFLTYETKEVGTKVGNFVPDFTSQLWETDGKTGSLSDYKGDVIVLNLWATWCRHCKKEMPDLMKFYDDYKDEGVSVVTVNMTRFERAPREENIKNFVEEVGVTLPIFYNHEDEFYKIYKPQGLPSTYIIDRNFVIRHAINGEVTYEQLEKLVLPLTK